MQPQGVYDVVVIGGGPAGMMAASEAKKRGRKVILIEKNTTLGKKLLITGGGRCNVTNNKPVVREMLARYKKNDKFLFSAFAQFAVTETLNYFHTRGIETHEEQEGRVFPDSQSARSIWQAQVTELELLHIPVLTKAKVLSVSKDEASKLFTIKLSTKTMLQATSCVLATGGLSHPETGSTGEGFIWSKALGHTIHEQDFALVPIALKDSWVKNAAGVSLSNAHVTLFLDGKKESAHKGKLLFTHVGVSGPVILSMSREVGDLLQYGTVQMKLDLFATQDHRQVKDALQKVLIGSSNKKIKNVLRQFVPSSLVLPLLDLANIKLDTFCHSVTTEERKELVRICKAVPLHVSHLLGADKAIVSSGGVVPEEIDFKTMESRIVSGLYIVGDMLHIDRPSGGYSLQLCWTTGFVAGQNC